MHIRIWNLNGIWLMNRDHDTTTSYVLNPDGPMRDGVANLLCFLGIWTRDENGDPVIAETEVEIAIGDVPVSNSGHSQECMRLLSIDTCICGALDEGFNQFRPEADRHIRDHEASAAMPCS